MFCFYCNRVIQKGETYCVSSDGFPMCINCAEDDDWMGCYPTKINQEEDDE